MGPQKVSFGVHKRLICQVSSFFKAALTGKFKEANEGTVVLQDEKVKVFKVFNGWLYTRAIVLEQLCKGDTGWEALTDLYVFAEKMGIPSLQNAAIDVIIATTKTKKLIPGMDQIAHAWENTSENSGFRRLLVDYYAHWLDYEDMKSRLEQDWNRTKDLFIAVMLAFCKARDERRVVDKFGFWPKSCRYHVHNTDNPPCNE